MIYGPAFDMIIAAYWQLVKRVHARENEFSATQFLFREFSTICQTAFKTAYLQSRAGIFKAQHQNSNMRRENSGLKLFLSTVREAIIRKKFYFTKKFCKRGGGHLVFIPLFFFKDCVESPLCGDHKLDRLRDNF